MYRYLSLLPFIFISSNVVAQPESNISKGQETNFLVITVDDMNWDSVGAFGNKIKDITPNIDKIAAEGVKFDKAYVAASNCAPSRVAMQTGLYPQQSGARGFFYIDDKQTPSIATELRNNGFITGVINKSTDSNPAPRNEGYWDFRSGFNKVDKYSASSFGKKSANFFKEAKKIKKPFYLLVNIADPHKPNFNDPKATENGADANLPSRIIKELEITVPAFLPNLPAIRKDVRNYFNSVKRADDTVGHIMASLAKSGLAENTLVMFLSDHGMPFPFAKSSVYDNGLRTPMVMKWPGNIKAGTTYKDIVSVVDLMPTILDVADIELPKSQNYLGQALFANTTNTPTSKSEYAFGSFDENAKGYPVPMRGIISDEFNYVFNAWSDGKHTIKSAAMNHLTYKQMVKHSKNNKAITARVKHYTQRATEELCHLAVDPHCLVNLIDNPEYAAVQAELEKQIRAQMVRTNDYLLEAFDVKDDEKALQKFMDKQHKQAKQRAKELKWKRGSNIAGPTAKNTGLYQKTE